MLLAPNAHAQGDTASAPADLPALRERLQLHEPMAPRVERVWYGWQTLIADGVTGTVLLGLLMSGAEADPVWAALAAWGLATPVIHGVHGKYANALASTVLRAGGVALTYLVFVFSWLASWDGDGSDVGAVTWLTSIACVAGIAAIDASAMAYKERKVARGATALRLAPLADRTSRTLGLSLVGNL